jgi:hypothetical protein
MPFRVMSTFYDRKEAVMGSFLPTDFFSFMTSNWTKLRGQIRIHCNIRSRTRCSTDANKPSLTTAHGISLPDLYQYHSPITTTRPVSISFTHYHHPTCINIIHPLPPPDLYQYHSPITTTRPVSISFTHYHYPTCINIIHQLPPPDLYQYHSPNTTTRPVSISFTHYHHPTCINIIHPLPQPDLTQ